MRFNTKSLTKIVNITTIFVVLNIQICVFLTGCSSSAPQSSDPISKTALALHTVVTITVYDEKDEHLIAECIDLCRQYEKIFSRTDEESELYALNAAGGAEVSDELLEAIELSLRYCEVSNGAFDITTGALSSLYAFGTENAGVPSPEAIAEALPHVGYEKIRISGSTVTLEDPAAIIDLGAVAKGYIADRLCDFLTENGVKSAIIDLGGNIVCLGEKPDGTDYRVGIQYPFKDRSVVIATVGLSDMSVVTSGVYERCFEEDGRLYHHILDPEIGYPYENGLLSVSIVAESSAEADALSTTCFAMGLADGMELINSLEGVYAVFVTEDFELHYSDGFESELLLN